LDGPQNLFATYIVTLAGVQLAIAGFHYPCAEIKEQEEAANVFFIYEVALAIGISFESGLALCIFPFTCSRIFINPPQQ
jgi:putative Mn2+ efflux pump MntP